MGRGLSPLQQTMLVLALRNHDAEGRSFDSDIGADCYHPEVYAAAYGWVVQKRWQDGRRSHLMRADPPSGRAGPRERAAIMAAVSRAARRLYQRGLARHVGNAWAGINLTPEGYEVAKDLTVKTEVKSSSS